MSISTHRWQSNILKRKFNRSLRNIPSSQRDKCLVNVKFEKSSYFSDALLPNHIIYPAHSFPLKGQPKPHGEEKVSFLTQSNETKHLDEICHKRERKLFQYEYILSNSVGTLMKKYDNHVRVYIITDNLDNREELVIAEKIKLILDDKTWSSFRLLLLYQQDDIKDTILRNTPVEENEKVVKIETLSFSSVSIMSDEKESNIDKKVINVDKKEGNIDKKEGNVDKKEGNVDKKEGNIDKKESNVDKKESDTDKKESNSTIITRIESNVDDDTDSTVKKISNKYRDSQLISHPKLINVEVDPVEKCFIVIQTILEDNIFSTGKNLTEVRQIINEILDFYGLTD